ncbi:hypothetical protein DB88DRAFT_491424 [Papiliotrema laurentii]|uniref:Uncharacterized protein n=1 Tax=Papiliotrema laurentii TaxID=5418 RepID=A0AAD9CWT3_PAPLA|nr:hypothetical protein DB88DRAFT_491424 [Papiliotrema laurentii]
MDDNPLFNPWNEATDGQVDDEEEPPDTATPPLTIDTGRLLAFSSQDSVSLHTFSPLSSPSTSAIGPEVGWSTIRTPSRIAMSDTPSTSPSVNYESPIEDRSLFFAQPDPFASSVKTEGYTLSVLSASPGSPDGLPSPYSHRTSLDEYILDAKRIFQKKASLSGFYLGMCWVEGLSTPYQFSGVSHRDDEYDHEADVWPWEGILGEDRDLSACAFRLSEDDKVASLDCRPSRMSVYDMVDSVWSSDCFSVQMIVAQLSALESPRFESMLMRYVGAIHTDLPIMILRISPTPHRWLNPVQSYEACGAIALVDLLATSARIFGEVLKESDHVFDWSVGVTWRIQRFCADRRRARAESLSLTKG